MAAIADTPTYTAPGVEIGAATRIVEILQDRLVATIDLQLTLKHVHWNVVGPHFIAVHQMLDPQVDAAREMSDELAERIATLGGSPVGTPGAVVSGRRWEDYAMRRDSALKHLRRSTRCTSASSRTTARRSRTPRSWTR